MAYTLVYTTIDDETTSLTGYTGTPEGTITVPDYYDGRRVVSIGLEAFTTAEITGVDIGANVVSIGISAFDGCASLVDVTGGQSVTTLGDSCFRSCQFVSFPYLPLLESTSNAFCDCVNLEEITFSASLQYMSTDEFSGCSALQKITFLGDVPVLSSSSYFENVDATIYCYAWSEGFTNPFRGLSVQYIRHTANLFPSGYDTLALSVWGINLGIPRPYYGTPSVPFTDAMYSRLLLARIMLLNMTGSMADINKYIAFLFPDRRVTVVDNLNMTITYWFPAALTDEETALLAIDGVLPRPAGVEAIIDIEDSDKTIFSFEGTRAGNFDQSVFVEEPEYEAEPT